LSRHAKRKILRKFKGKNWLEVQKVKRRNCGIWVDGLRFSKNMGGGGFEKGVGLKV